MSMPALRKIDTLPRDLRIGIEDHRLGGRRLSSGHRLEDRLRAEAGVPPGYAKYVFSSQIS